MTEWSPAATPRRVWPSRIFALAARHRDVREQGDRESRADRRAANRRDDGLAAVDQVVDEVARLAPDAQQRRLVGDHALDHLEIAAGGEMLAGAAHEDRAHAGIRVDRAPDVREIAGASPRSRSSGVLRAR